GGGQRISRKKQNRDDRDSRDHRDKKTESPPSLCPCGPCCPCRPSLGFPARRTLKTPRRSTAASYPAAAPALSNAARISSIRFRFTPKSRYPRREAERKWICFAPSSKTNSTSSTKRKTFERHSALR